MCLSQTTAIVQYNKSSEDMLAQESFLAKPTMRDTRDTGTQTEMHPMESNIDPSYQWNEWELRRRAIQQANCRTNRSCMTTQTLQSHMRRDTRNQAYPPCDVACQTARDVGTGMPRPVVYVAGLRGHTMSHAIKTDLTVDEN